ncbi:permease [Clostridium perfringens]|uniref:permease n=1 Tax=Clostridium perfringens TaxID=1502 RepID=UPI000D70DD41|nr:permease [Clostridium perfringens]MBO3424429.1 permease [Clostridium perfringens]PWX10391.1 permease [Clostridium perfringens]PWX37283.1 permease [Clostridium perfringens]PWX59096.1 permease [Clostridium perfringens]
MLVGFLNFLLAIVFIIGLLLIVNELIEVTFILGAFGFILVISSALLFGLINNFITNDMKILILLIIAYFILNMIISIFLSKKDIKNKALKRIVYSGVVVSWLFNFYLSTTCVWNILKAYIRS